MAGAEAAAGVWVGGLSSRAPCGAAVEAALGGATVAGGGFGAGGAAVGGGRGGLTAAGGGGNGVVGAGARGMAAAGGAGAKAVGAAGVGAEVSVRRGGALLDIGIDEGAEGGTTVWPFGAGRARVENLGGETGGVVSAGDGSGSAV